MSNPFGELFGFRILLIMFALPLLVIGLFLPSDEDTANRKRNRSLECRRQIVEAAERGDYQQTKELVYKWQSIDRDDHRPGSILIAMSAISMTDDEKMEYAARVASVERSP